MSENTPFRALVIALLGALRGRIYARFSLGLVSIGALLAFPPAWEFVLQIALYFWKKYDPTLQLSVSSSTSIAGPFVGGILMILGIILFLVFFQRDEELRFQQEKSARYFRVSIPKTNAWIRRAEMIEGSQDPRYHYELPLLFETGNAEVRIYSINVTRYCFGCACWTHNPALKESGGARTTHQFQGDGKLLQVPLHLPAVHGRAFWYVNEGTGPAPGFDIDELESGEYEVEIYYGIGDVAEAETLTIFIRQHRGSITTIEGISQTPFMSDEAVRTATVTGVITADEETKLLRLSARERYLIVRLGNQYARRKEHTKHLEHFVRGIHERILFKAEAQR